MRFLLIVLSAIGAFLYYLWDKNERSKKREEDERRARELEEQLPAIQEALTQFVSHSKKYDLGYFNHHKLLEWKESTSKLLEIIKNRYYDRIGLDPKNIATIKLFEDYHKNGAFYRKDYNKEFIKQELVRYNKFFDKVENRKLDIQQRTAIITDEDNNLIIAGAGSGKTTTIVGKVGYIVDRYKVPPDQILLISFTNKSASSLAERINIPGVEAKTFHKFGKDVIVAVEQKQPTIFDEDQYTQLITKFFEELLADTAYLNKVASYFTNFLKPVKSQDEFKNQGEYIQYLKDQNFSTYKTRSVQYGNRITVKREVVKSIEECNIANFLLFNNLDYEYEAPYIHETATLDHRQYKPDFTIKSNGQTVYLEHLAINKNGTVPHFFADTERGETIEQATGKYKEGIKWKRELHKKHGTPLIETYSHEMLDEVLFNNLSKNLAAIGLPIKPKPPGEIWKLISEAAKDEIDSFIRLFEVFITLMKSNNYSIEDIRNRNEQGAIKFHRERNSLFLEIITPIFEMYQNYLTERKEIDFSDMINKATEYFATGKYKKKLSYVIIDEFQDISIGRYRLVKVIKDTNPGCKLFCVGDDWQSIYRFAGSDISLFKDFEEYFGYAEKLKIETTYRFNNPLIDRSSKFVLKNANQTRKELRAINSNRFTTHAIVYSNQENDDSYALRDIFRELLSSGKAKDKEIIILGRYSFDIDRIKNEERFFGIDKKNETISYAAKTANGEIRRLSAQFMTIHKAKGLEADIIIVINCNSGKHGFPSGISDDPILNLLLSDADQFENSEERRLFYVAMTRARELVYFVSDILYKSKFITELEGQDQQTTIKKCPRCITADLVRKTGIKNGKEWAFDGCSNFVYGCDYKKWV